MQILVSERGGDDARARRDALAARWGFEAIARDALDPERPALVVTREGLRLRHRGVDRRWHDGMLHALRAAGAAHPLVRLTGLAPGHTVFDGTLGLGTDARFLSEWTGRTVVGVECVPALGLMAEEGLARVGADVRVRIGDGLDVLRDSPDDAYDVVLADPMFPPRDDPGPGHAGRPAPTLEGVRWIADARPLDRAWRDEALRVARRAVIVRDLRGHDLLERLEAPHVWTRRGRKARYGVWRLDGVDLSAPESPRS